MTSAEKQSYFKGRIDALKERYGETVGVEDIADVVESLLESLDGGFTGSDVKIYREIEHLVRYIEKAKGEIEALYPAELRRDKIPDAADQLDAIVTHTEEATGTILDCAEAIETVAASLDGDPQTKLRETVTKIYEACNFQDVTGQRITKVVGTLKHIEEELDHLLAVFGIDQKKLLDQKPDAAPAAGDKALMNGPQLPEDAHRQDEIDALLASFD